MSIFFTSDIHAFHKKILEYEPDARQFSSVEIMNDTIVERWNSKVSKNDEIFILGDVSFGKLKETVDFLSRLNGKLCLVSGNHDVHLTKHQEFIDCFDGRVFDLLDHKINGKHYVMCHYPLRAWNRSHYGAINLFGHLHSKWKGNRQQLNVGMDLWNLTPLAIEEIPSILESLPEDENKIYA
jgi:calcineurin-like phosphoesterase family protein